MNNLIIILLGLLLAAVTGYLAFTRWQDANARQATLDERLQGLQLDTSFEALAPERMDAWQAKLPGFMRVWIAAADVRLNREVVLIYLTGVLFGAGLLWRLVGIAPGAILLAAGLAAPIVAIRQLALHRKAKFAEFLPYFLDSLRQLLVVGNSFQQAFNRATDGANPAVQRYLVPAVRRIRNGAPIADALTIAADRVNSVELHMLTSAVRINQRFGGAIGPVLTDLTNLLRDRARVGREIKSATAEVRMSGVVLGGLPFAAVLLMAITKYDYISFLWTEEAGHRLVMIAAVLWGIGLLLMRRIMRFDF